MEYIYYHFCTADLSEVWSTADIEQYLQSTGLFPADKLVSARPFLDIGLMKIRNRNSWSSKDYDPQQTNYISIVTSTNYIDDPQIRAVLDGLAALLHTDLQDDW